MLMMMVMMKLTLSSHGKTLYKYTLKVGGWSFFFLQYEQHSDKKILFFRSCMKIKDGLDDKNSERKA